MTRDERRSAERHSPPKPVPASFGGFAAKILDISLIGCRIEHTDRLPPRARFALRFLWRGAKVRVDATVVRSELTSMAGKPVYVSGLEFGDSADAPPLIREIVGWLAAEARKAEPPPISPPDVEEEPELLSPSYLRCTFATGQWSKLFVDDPAQPADGFTIRAPADEGEAAVLCRAYEQADAAKRRTMRASFERDINKRGRP